MCVLFDSIHAVPGIPTFLGFDELDATTCGSVTFTWDQPSIDERNGMCVCIQL